MKRIFIQKDSHCGFKKHNPSTVFNVIYVSEQSGVADRRDVDDRLRGVSYVKYQEISILSRKDTDQMRLLMCVCVYLEIFLRTEFNDIK